MSRPSVTPDSRRRGVVAVIVQDDKFLVIRRSQFVRAPGMHCFPGGAIEAHDADEAAAVRRELLEELHVDVRPVRRVWQSITPWNVELSWWLATLDPRALPRPDELEVEACYWLTAEEIQALPALLPSNSEFLQACRTGAVALAPSGD